MSSRIERITEQRLEKLARLREQGIDPYPHRYHRSHTTEEAARLLEHAEQNPDESHEIATVSVAGRITAQRRMGKITFLDLRDGSGKIQLFCHRDKLSEAVLNLIKELDIGDIIGAQGKPFRTRTGEPTIEVTGLDLLSKSLHPLPEKWHGLSDIDTRFRQRYLDLIANAETMETFRIKSRLIAGMRAFLNGRDFVEVETPILQPDAGGALAQPFITHHHALDRNLYLRIALELHLKRLIVGGFDKVYELGRTFRNEGISTRHNPEFTMMESYEAYADYGDVMNMLEEMCAHLCREVLGTDTVAYGEHMISFKPPWPRLELRQAVIEYADIDFEEHPDAASLRERMRAAGLEADAAKDRGRLIDQLLSDFVEPNLVQPTFLIDYPLDMSPLAKKKPDNPRFVERFEAFAGGMEIANAFTELNDPIEQRQRFEKQLKSRTGDDAEQWTIDEDFLTAMEYGMPPTGGLGVGVDRLTMIFTGQQSIREVILFPHLKEKPE